MADPAGNESNAGSELALDAVAAGLAGITGYAVGGAAGAALGGLVAPPLATALRVASDRLRLVFDGRAAEVVAHAGAQANIDPLELVERLTGSESGIQLLAEGLAAAQFAITDQAARDRGLVWTRRRCAGRRPGAAADENAA